MGWFDPLDCQQTGGVGANKLSVSTHNLSNEANQIFAMKVAFVIASVLLSSFHDVNAKLGGQEVVKETKTDQQGHRRLPLLCGIWTSYDSAEYKSQVWTEEWNWELPFYHADWVDSGSTYCVQMCDGDSFPDTIGKVEFQNPFTSENFSYLGDFDRVLKVGNKVDSGCKTRSDIGNCKLDDGFGFDNNDLFKCTPPGESPPPPPTTTCAAGQILIGDECRANDPVKFRQCDRTNSMNIWCTTLDNEIVMYDGALDGATGTRGWKKIPGGLKHVAASGDGNHVWGISPHNAIYKWTGTFWQIDRCTGSSLERLDVSYDGLWIWGTAGNAVFRRNGWMDCWHHVAGSIKQVSVGGVHGLNVWGVTWKNDVFHYRGYWHYIPGKMKEVSVGKDDFVVGTNGVSHYSRQGHGGTWKLEGPVNSTTTFSAVQANRYLMVRSDGSLWWVDNRPEAGPPRHVPVSVQDLA